MGKFVFSIFFCVCVVVYSIKTTINGFQILCVIILYIVRVDLRKRTDFIVTFFTFPGFVLQQTVHKIPRKWIAFFPMCNLNWRSHSEYIDVKLSNKRWMIASNISDKSESNSTDSLKLECLIRYRSPLMHMLCIYMSVCNCFQSLWV